MFDDSVARCGDASRAAWSPEKQKTARRFLCVRFDLPAGQ
jgi:hypothetical protein